MIVEIKGCPYCHAAPIIRKDKPTEWCDSYECDCYEHALLQINRGITHCPTCGASKKINKLQSFTVLCPHHPEHPVSTSFDTLENTILFWDDDGEIYGIDTSKLAKRPNYLVAFNPLSLGA